MPWRDYTRVIRGKPGQLEVYNDERYFVFTGERLDGAPRTIEPREAALNVIGQKFLVGRAEAGSERSSVLYDDSAWDDPSAIEEGERHKALIRFVGGMYATGVRDRGKLLNAAYEYNNQFDEPLTGKRLDEIPRMVDYVVGKEAAREDEFWQSTNILRQIHDHAQAQRAAPWAVLGCVLARVSAATSRNVMLPGLGQGANVAPLNMYIALVGAPGRGKDLAMNQSWSAVELGDPEETYRLGSGEGIGHVYKKPDTGPHDGWIRRAALFLEPEVETVVTLGERRGATLMSELRSAWSGGPLGHSFSNKSKRINIRKFSYRIALVLGVQPKKAGVILDDVEGGFPQRFVWLVVSDPFAPDIVPERVEQLFLAGRLAYENVPTESPDRVIMPICARAVTEIDAAALERLRGEDVDPHSGHRLQTKLRVAACLAILHGFTEVEELWWHLAEYVMQKSDQGRHVCTYFARLGREQEARSRGRTKGVIDSEAAERVERNLHQRCKDKVLKKVTRSWITRGQIREALTSGDMRHYLDGTLSELVESGELEKRRVPSKTGSMSFQYRRKR